MKYSKWIVRAPDEAAAQRLMKRGFGRLAAATLASRGVSDENALSGFLDTDPSGLRDPFLLKDMDRAVSRIRRALGAGERIAVYGDYDADGLTAACILVKYLRSAGADCVYHIPERLGEGYGLNAPALKALRDGGATLAVTVDTGISALSEAAYAASIGLDLVITDHHEPGKALPEAAAAVDPHRPDCAYPFKGFAGAGVAFKLVCALAGSGRMPALLDEYAGLAAVGTVADVMPVTDENRILVARGLQRLGAGPGAGLAALLLKAGAAGRRMDASLIGYALAPRLNAAGRMGSAELAERLLLTEDPAEADGLAGELCRLNRKRQQIENDILIKAEKMLSESGLADLPVLVLADESFHPGVAGIVCAKLCERYGRPALLVCTEGETGRGSARCAPGFNLFAALSACAGLLESFGGHELAAGFTVRTENVDALRAGLCGYAESLGEAAAQRPLTVDCAVLPEDVTMENLRGLTVLEPYGPGNPQPVFLLENVRVSDIRSIGAGRHTRFSAGGLGAVYFGMEAGRLGLSEGVRADIAAYAEINGFMGERAQLTVCDVRPCARARRACARAAGLFEDLRGPSRPGTERTGKLYPERGEFEALWRYLRKTAADGLLSTDETSLICALAGEDAGPEAGARVLVCLEVFRECGLIELRRNGGALSVRLRRAQGKTDLFSSPLLLSLKAGMV